MATQLAQQVASRFKEAAGYDGPYVWIEDNYLQVWISMDSYGRVHHVTSDLVGAEKILEKHRQKLASARRDLSSQGIYVRDVGDIYVDGLSGGRNRMIVNFTLRAEGTWDSDQQDAVMSHVPQLRMKSPPR